MPRIAARAAGLAPGLAIALLVAATATFLSEHYGAPVMLYALLIGMALNFLTEAEKARAGIAFASSGLLRIGVALLGLRIGWQQVTALGWAPLLLVAGLVAATLLVSIAVARAMGFCSVFGFLSGGATAICGASAAMALSAALPAHPNKERATLFAVVGVSTLSTVAMILYPLAARLAGLGDHEAGIFIGATIHDVAQVTGAGYAISTEAGDTAIVVKLLRVAMLLPTVIAAGILGRRSPGASGARPPLLPWFAIAFAVLVAANSLLPLPEMAVEGGGLLSRWCLVTAIAAIGIKTHLKAIVELGWRPVALMLAETLFLALVALAVIWLGFI